MTPHGRRVGQMGTCLSDRDEQPDQGDPSLADDDVVGVCGHLCDGDRCVQRVVAAACR